MQVLTSVNRWEKGQRGGINESTGGQGSMYAPVMMGLVYNHNIKKRSETPNAPAVSSSILIIHTFVVLYL